MTHVPSVVAHVADLPTTHSGKRSERAATDALNNRPVPNEGALRNPETLAAIRNHPALVLMAHDEPADKRFFAGDSAEEVERALTAIWEAVLGVSPVAPDANFFDLGGYSLLAVTLLHRVEKAFGRRLPMATLLSSASTITQMAQVLRRAHVENSSSIVTIQAHGVRPPVFWVPGGGGLSVLAFRQVSLRLGQEQPVHGFEARITMENAPTSVQEIAARYVAELIAFYPSGPYWLFGFSLGGLTAFEMAVQLRARGAEVGMLTLFDPVLPQHLTSTQKVRFLAQRSVYHARTLLAGAPSDLAARLRGAALTAQIPIKRALTLRAHRNAPTPVAAEEPATVFDQLDSRNRLALEAYTRGQLPTFDGKATLILAKRTYRSALSPDLDARLGWARFVTGGIEVHRVPGSVTSWTA